MALSSSSSLQRMARRWDFWVVLGAAVAFLGKSANGFSNIQVAASVRHTSRGYPQQRQQQQQPFVTDRRVASKNVQDDLQLLYEDDNDNDDDTIDNDDDDYYEEEGTTSTTSLQQKNRVKRRWEQLDPKYKQYLIQKGQERAVANKQKRTAANDKKRQLYMFVKEQQRAKKRAAKIHRPLSFQNRTLLADLPVGSEVEGTVISLTNFGAYVDIGTECDGLLHVSQISTDAFVEHPRQVLTPGDAVVVRIRSTSPERKKLHLTMLPLDVLEQEQAELATKDDKISLDDIMLDDELWGQIKRVTDFGAYVEVGAVVDGWLHFMDHPSWDGAMHPSEFMQRGDRIRVWVSDMDKVSKKQRLKLTAVRPSHLPGPRRELF